MKITNKEITEEIKKIKLKDLVKRAKDVQKEKELGDVVIEFENAIEQIEQWKSLCPVIWEDDGEEGGISFSEQNTIDIIKALYSWKIAYMTGCIKYKKYEKEITHLIYCKLDGNGKKLFGG